MNIKLKTEGIGLTSNNAVIIGSGILNALGLRPSKDIDVIVTEEKYKELSVNSNLRKGEIRGKEVLKDDLFEIGISWSVLSKTWSFNDLIGQSVIIDGIRYITIQFLLSVKKSWLTNGESRDKDIEDIKLIENYLKSVRI